MRDAHESTLTELEFEQLPPALRRKFFSSLERLRLAHDGAHPPRFMQDCKRPRTATLIPHPSSLFTRRPSSNLDDRLFRCSSTTRNRLRKPSRPGHIHTISRQDVAQFAALPPTLQRKHFSREEQILLASRIDSVILDAADEAVFRHIRVPPSKPRPRGRSTPSRAFDKDIDLDLDDSSDDEMVFTPQELQSFKWLDESKNLDLSLYDYHAAVAETVGPIESPEKARRSLSFSNMSFGKRSSSRKSLSGRISLPSSLKQAQAIAAVAPVQGHRRNKLSTSSLEPAATHYRDPAARMKLRVYLASPQKFDEAIEFGFPSLQDQATARSPRTGPDRASGHELARTFYDDDEPTPSLSDGEDRDYEDIDSPKTPSAFSHGMSQNSSLDRTAFRPRTTRDFLDPYVHASASNREMTLHMTLTRPDLRAPDEVPPARLINSIPLEQPPLIIPDSPASFWDSLPDEESKVKKILRRLRLRG